METGCFSRDVVDEDARLERGVSSQQGDAAHETRGGGGESAVNLSGLIDPYRLTHDRNESCRFLIEMQIIRQRFQPAGYLAHFLTKKQQTNIQLPTIDDAGND